MTAGAFFNGNRTRSGGSPLQIFPAWFGVFRTGKEDYGKIDMDNAKKIVAEISRIVLLLAALQLLRMGIKSLFFLFAERTDFTDRVASLIAMVLLSAGIVLAARYRKTALSVFPKRFGLLYVVATVGAAAFFVLTPILAKDAGVQAIVLLIYSAVVVPAFEELVFRSVVWNRLKACFSKEWIVWLADSALFALWHFGYADTLAFRVETGLMTALFWKAVTGLCFGLVLGAVRLKTKNSYSTMLLHGVMNIFGR